MSVHQINEFYVHLNIPESKVDDVTALLLSECWGYEIHEGDLTIEGFSSEGEAEQFESKINAVLLK